MYPIPGNFNPLYPTNANYVLNPMTSDLNGGAHKITNLDELDLTGIGAITGVNTINGLSWPYVPPNIVNRNKTFTFPNIPNIYGDGSQTYLFTIYSGPNNVNLQLVPMLDDPNINLIMLTLPVNIQQNTGGQSDQGLFDFYLRVEGIQRAHSGQYIIAPRQPLGIAQVEASSIATLTFFLVKGADYNNSMDDITLWGAGAYNYTYWFNYNLQHANDSLPTICNAVAFR